MKVNAPPERSEGADGFGARGFGVVGRLDQGFVVENFLCKSGVDLCTMLS